MCQPGRPGPQGDCHDGSPGLAAFHRAKSAALRFRGSTSTRLPAWLSSYHMGMYVDTQCVFSHKGVLFHKCVFPQSVLFHILSCFTSVFSDSVCSKSP